LGRRGTTLLIVTALVVAGCGGKDGGNPKGGEAAGSRGSEQGRGGSALRRPLPPKRCSALTAEDVRLVSSLPARQIDLTSDPAEHVRCATAFIDTAGGLIVEIRQSDGDGSELKRLRRTTGKELGRKTVRQVGGLGPGAFVARRVLAFAHGAELVRLDTGYNREGRLALRVDQLVRLARRVASRI
jgi:hypothetical protein